MCSLSNVPGLVPDSPRRATLARIGWGKRSMVAAEIEDSMASVFADSGWKLVAKCGSHNGKAALHP